ncbi:MAG: riboflavin biosynthesis protein RibF [candidate division NC10 bacterium]|nr:riboflavin biosynthesis protein RibF [candidate division NC10 bacterium]
MRVIQAGGVQDLRWDVPTPVLAMGTMDGVHLGHQAILRRVRERAAAMGGTPAILTFARHPLEVVRPAQAPPLITPLPVKLALLGRLGMAAAAAIHFTEAMAGLEPEAFVRAVLVDGLRVAGLCVGYDFGFGKGRRGNADLLQALAPGHGVWVEVIPPVSLDGVVVSSRMIRGLLAEGEVEEARRFLGRPYCLEGEVQPGAGRGRELGFPTANVAVPEAPPLCDGVYAGRVLVRGGFQDAMMNLGCAPTFGPGGRRLEIHMPGWETPLYGERVVAFFLRRLRDEQRFASAQALAEQLGRDRQAAEAVWQAARALPWPEWTLHS